MAIYKRRGRGVLGPGNFADPHVRSSFKCRQHRKHRTGPQLYFLSDERRTSAFPLTLKQPSNPVRCELVATDTMDLLLKKPPSYTCCCHEPNYNKPSDSLNEGGGGDIGPIAVSWPRLKAWGTTYRFTVSWRGTQGLYSQFTPLHLVTRWPVRSGEKIVQWRLTNDDCSN